MIDEIRKDFEVNFTFQFMRKVNGDKLFSEEVFNTEHKKLLDEETVNRAIRLLGKKNRR